MGAHGITFGIVKKHMVFQRLKHQLELRSLSMAMWPIDVTAGYSGL